MKYRRLSLRSSVLCIFCYLVGILTSTLYCFYSCDISAPKETINERTGQVGSQPVLAVLIFSALNNMEQRDTIRQTWLKLTKSDNKMVHYFAIGSGRLDDGEMKTLQSENVRFGDLLLLPRVNDSYKNLAQKLLSSLVWLSRNAAFDYLLKADDDSFVQTERVINELTSAPQKRRLYWGFFDGRAHVKRQGQWQESDWILCDRYLPYAVGGGYVISRDLVEFVASNEQFLKLFSSEDVSLGTWLAPLDIRRVHDPRFDTEYKSRGCHNSYLVTHKQSVEQMREKYWFLQDKGRICRKQTQTRYSYDYNWKVPPSQCCVRNNSSIP